MNIKDFIDDVKQEKANLEEEQRLQGLKELEDDRREYFDSILTRVKNQTDFDSLPKDRAIIHLFKTYDIHHSFSLPVLSLIERDIIEGYSLIHYARQQPGVPDKWFCVYLINTELWDSFQEELAFIENIDSLWSNKKNGKIFTYLPKTVEIVFVLSVAALFGMLLFTKFVLLSTLSIELPFLLTGLLGLFSCGVICLVDSKHKKKYEEALERLEDFGNILKDLNSSNLITLDYGTGGLGTEYHHFVELFQSKGISKTHNKSTRIDKLHHRFGYSFDTYYQGTLTTIFVVINTGIELESYSSTPFELEVGVYPHKPEREVESIKPVYTRYRTEEELKSFYKLLKEELEKGFR